jgi:hypothetical protein
VDPAIPHTPDQPAVGTTEQTGYRLALKIVP